MPCTPLELSISFHLGISSHLTAFLFQVWNSGQIQSRDLEEETTHHCSESHKARVGTFWI